MQQDNGDDWRREPRQKDPSLLSIWFGWSEFEFNQPVQPIFVYPISPLLFLHFLVHDEKKNTFLRLVR